MIQLLRVEDVAKMLKVSPSTIYELTSSGKLHYIRISKSGKRYTEGQVEEFMKENTK